MNTIYIDNTSKNVSKTFIITQQRNTHYHYKNVLERLKTRLKSILMMTATIYNTHTNLTAINICGINQQNNAKKC